MLDFIVQEAEDHRAQELRFFSWKNQGVKSRSAIVWADSSWSLASSEEVERLAVLHPPPKGLLELENFRLHHKPTYWETSFYPDPQEIGEHIKVWKI